MARAVMAGVDPAALPLMSFTLLTAIANEHRRDARRMRRDRERAERGMSGWDWRAIPPAPPDGEPCDRDLFINYGMAAGAPREWCEAEYARQTREAAGGDQ